jgi:hypothetical protein
MCLQANRLTKLGLALFGTLSLVNASGRDRGRKGQPPGRKGQPPVSKGRVKRLAHQHRDGMMHSDWSSRARAASRRANEETMRMGLQNVAEILRQQAAAKRNGPSSSTSPGSSPSRTPPPQPPARGGFAMAPPATVHSDADDTESDSEAATVHSDDTEPDSEDPDKKDIVAIKEDGLDYGLINLDYWKELIDVNRRKRMNMIWFKSKWGDLFLNPVQLGEHFARSTRVDGKEKWRVLFNLVEPATGKGEINLFISNESKQALEKYDYLDRHDGDKLEALEKQRLLELGL